MAKKDIITTQLEELDKPIESSLFDIFKGNKLICRIIYEDGSYKDFSKKFGDSYKVTIKGRDYFVIPKCIMRGKRPTISWFFNNPRPINFEYKNDPIKRKLIIGEQKVEVTLDSESLNQIFNTNILKSMYANKPFMTGKVFVTVMVLLGVLILVVLQLTGTVDIIGMIQGK